MFVCKLTYPEIRPVKKLTSKMFISLADSHDWQAIRVVKVANQNKREFIIKIKVIFHLSY